MHDAPVDQERLCVIRPGSFSAPRFAQSPVQIVCAYFLYTLFNVLFMHISRGVTDDTYHKWTCAMCIVHVALQPHNSSLNLALRSICFCIFHHTLGCAFSYNAPLHKVLIEHIYNFIFVRLLFCSAVCIDIAHF